MIEWNGIDEDDEVSKALATTYECPNGHRFVVVEPCYLKITVGKTEVNKHVFCHLCYGEWMEKTFPVKKVGA